MSLSIEVSGKSDVGCVRTNNEDNFGYDTQLGIFVVCDGMGGAAAGEVASKIGVDTVLEYFRDADRTGIFPHIGENFEGYSDRANALASAVQLANNSIYAIGSTQSERRGMGCTDVGA